MCYTSSIMKKKTLPLPEVVEDCEENQRLWREATMPTPKILLQSTKPAPKRRPPVQLTAPKDTKPS